VDAPLLLLETLAFDAWPAAEVRDLDGWRLRSTGGVTRRANSVWPNQHQGRLPLPELLAAVEDFYGEREQPALYQLSPLARPAELDAVLAARGYAVDAPTSICVAEAAAAARSPDAGIRVQVEGALFDEWFEISGRRGRFSETQAMYRGLLERLGERALYALAELEGESAAVGLAVVDRAWAGVFSMLTLTAHRKRGLARAVLGALAGAAQARGATNLYLQVELENQAARALYAGFGFRERYRYHYRVSPRA